MGPPLPVLNAYVIEAVPIKDSTLAPVAFKMSSVVYAEGPVMKYPVIRKMQHIK